VRERFAVEEVTFCDGKASGIRGNEVGAAPLVERGRFIVGADGKHSLLARATAAPRYQDKGILATAYYAYWSGLQVNGGETYGRPRRAIGVWPTNNGLTITFIAAPADEASAFRADAEGLCMKSLDLAGDLGERVRNARLVGKFRGTSDLPNFFRRPYGPNWALVGDAGAVMDPISGQGISQALCDAQLLSDALSKAFEGPESFETALTDYERRRNRRALPIYKLTIDMASFRAMRPEEKVFFRALADKPEAADRFFGLLAGTVPYSEFRSARHVLSVMGIAGIGRAIAARAGLAVG
jgi:2-polyprenyl-6-methoxyphenol hydroxylase-like FAD-dependent oxidoreductase